MEERRGKEKGILKEDKNEKENGLMVKRVSDEVDSLEEVH